MDCDWIEAILQRDERDGQISRILNVSVERAVPKGDNYASVILRAKLDIMLKSGRKIKKSIIIKQELDSKFGEKIKGSSIFKIEVLNYQDILRKMEHLMDEFNDKRDTLWCQMLGFEPYSKILFEDLTDVNYAVVDRRKGLDYNHASLALKAIGRFHAMSKILLERSLISKEGMKSYFVIDDSPIGNNMFSGGLKQLYHTMLSSWPSEWKDCAERIGVQVVEYYNQFKTLKQLNDVNDFHVLNHGDCWNCNMLFRNCQYSGEPVSVKFIDFQVCHIGSYIWDVIYFLYTSVKPEIRREHLSNFLKIYWQSLDATLKYYNYSGNIPTLDDIIEEIEKNNYFAFTILAVFYPLMTADSTEAVDFDKMLDLETSHMAFNSSIMKSDNFIKQVGEDFKNFMKLGVI